MPPPIAGKTRTVTEIGERDEFAGYTIKEPDIGKSCASAGLPHERVSVAAAEVRIRIESAHSNCTFTPPASNPFQDSVSPEPEATLVLDTEKSIIGCADV